MIRPLYVRRFRYVRKATFGFGKADETPEASETASASAPPMEAADAEVKDKDGDKAEIAGGKAKDDDWGVSQAVGNVRWSLIVVLC